MEKPCFACGRIFMPTKRQSARFCSWNCYLSMARIHKTDAERSAARKRQKARYYLRNRDEIIQRWKERQTPARRRAAVARARAWTAAHPKRGSTASMPRSKRQTVPRKKLPASEAHRRRLESSRRYRRKIGLHPRKILSPTERKRRAAEKMTSARRADPIKFRLVARRSYQRHAEKRRSDARAKYWLYRPGQLARARDASRQISDSYTLNLIVAHKSGLQRDRVPVSLVAAKREHIRLGRAIKARVIR